LRTLGLAWDVKLSKLSPVPLEAPYEVPRDAGRPHAALLVPPAVVDAEAMAATIASGD
jgi:hypothetical protein